MDREWWSVVNKSYLPRISAVAICVFVVGSVLVSIPALDGGSRPVDFLAQVFRLSGRFFPPDFSVLAEVGAAFFETFQIATLATLFSVVISVFIAAGTSEILSPVLVRWIFRLFLSFVRTVPSLIWAVILVALVGPTPRAGVIALTLYSIGYLGRFFIESIEASDKQPAQWLQAHGAKSFQVFQYSLWPNIKATLTSQSLWMWEYNIRSASIIGYVGAGGLGLQLHIYQEYGQWNRFSTVLLVFFAVVLVLEGLSALVRRAGRVERK